MQPRLQRATALTWMQLSCIVSRKNALSLKPSFASGGEKLFVGLQYKHTAFQPALYIILRFTGNLVPEQFYISK